MKDAGIASLKVLDELAAIPGITTQRIADALAKARNKAKNGDAAGLLVQRLRDRDREPPPDPAAERTASINRLAKASGVEITDV